MGIVITNTVDCLITSIQLFNEAKTATIGQITSPGVPSGSDFVFTFVNSHITDSFKFYPFVTHPSGSLYLNLAEVLVTCGTSSSIVSAPAVLPNTPPYMSYLMLTP